MEKTDLRYASVTCLALCMLGTASASPPGADSRLLSLVPPGAAIVAGLIQGREGSSLVLTRNNTTDWMDFESISGVDPTRKISCMTLAAASGSQGFLSEHSLLASGHFDSRHIFNSAEENGATESEYRGIAVLIVPPLERDKGISDDFRWLAFIDSQIAVFGTIPMVKEEVSRYLAHSPVDLSLMQRLSPLHSTDQSWCVINSAVYRIASVRRTWATLDPILAQPDHANVGLILGFHFGRHVEIEYEAYPDSGSSEENQTQTQSGFPEEPPSEAPPRASSFFSSNHKILPKMIRLSKKQYDDFIAQEETRELTYAQRMPKK